MTAIRKEGVGLENTFEIAAELHLMKESTPDVYTQKPRPNRHGKSRNNDFAQPKKCIDDIMTGRAKRGGNATWGRKPSSMLKVACPKRVSSEDEWKERTRQQTGKCTEP